MIKPQTTTTRSLPALVVLSALYCSILQFADLQVHLVGKCLIKWWKDHSVSGLLVSARIIALINPRLASDTRLQHWLIRAFATLLPLTLWNVVTQD